MSFLSRLFRRTPPPEESVIEVLPASHEEEPPVEVPEWKKRIARINELCERRKRETQILQGARVVDVDVDETNKREA